MTRNAVAQVELAGARFGGTEQADEAAAEVGGLADVGLGLRVARAQQENRGRGGHGGEEVGVALGAEFKLHGKHGTILAAKPKNTEAQRHRGEFGNWVVS